MLIAKHKPTTLVSPSRLDVMTKTSFVRSILTGTTSDFSRLVYRQFLLQSNGGQKFDENGKKNLQDYERSFFNLIDSLQRNGFDGPPIPVTQSGIFDGAHRLAACLELDIDVTKISVSGTDQIYDYRFMRRIGLSEELIQSAVREYLRFDERTRAFLLTDLDPNETSALLERLGQEAELVYSGQWDMSQIGIRRIMDLAYGHLPWWDDSKYETTVAERYGKPRRAYPVGLVLYIPGSKTTDLQALKVSLRSSLGGTRFDRNIHGSDNLAETERLATTLLSAPGRFFLNNSPIGRELAILNEIGVSRQKGMGGAVSGSAILSLYSDYQPSDLDFIHSRDLMRGDGDEHAQSYLNTLFRPFEIIDDPRRSFEYKGVVFISLGTWAAHRVDNFENKAISQLESLSKIAVHDGNPPIYTHRAAAVRAARYRRTKHLADRLSPLGRFIPRRLLLSLRKIMNALLQ